MIAAVAGVVLILSMFIFNWFNVDFGGDFLGVEVDAGVNAWDSMDLIRFILLITGLVAVGLAIAEMNSSDVNLPVAGSALVAGLGILSVVLVAYRIIDPPGPGGIGRSFGVFVGLAAAAGVAYGGWMSMQEEGTSFSDQADRFGGDDDGGTPPPPAA